MQLGLSHLGTKEFRQQSSVLRSMVTVRGCWMTEGRGCRENEVCSALSQRELVPICLWQYLRRGGARLRDEDGCK